MNNNEQLITKFYTAFANKDHKGMQSCYAANINFSDPAFPALEGKEAKAMWHMLINAAKDIQITFSHVTANDTTGAADWVAVYPFSLTGRTVTNVIHATFEFKNGLIKHTDKFDFWKWAGMAFGIRGQLLGWTPFFKNKVNATTSQRLKAFIDKNPAYQN